MTTEKRKQITEEPPSEKRCRISIVAESSTSKDCYCGGVHADGSDTVTGGGGGERNNNHNNKNLKTITWRIFGPPQITASLLVTNQKQEEHQNDSGSEWTPVYVYSRNHNRRGRLLGVSPSTADKIDNDDDKGNKSNQKQKQNHSVKYQIQFDNEEHAQTVPSKRLIPIFPTPSSSICVIVTKETVHYRQLAASQVTRDDHVLELGCSTGETARCFFSSKNNSNNNNKKGKGCTAAAVSSWVGFDTSSSMVETTRNRINEWKKNHQKRNDPAIRANALKMDALLDPTAASLAACQFHSKGPTVVFLDIGGNREIAGVVRMLNWVLFPPQSSLDSLGSVRLVVVKSKELFGSMYNNNNDNDNVQDAAASGGCVENGIFRAVSSKGNNNNQWFRELLQESLRITLPKHPLQAPRQLSPVDHTTPICRYHNYYREGGCAKGKACPFDHEHCHLCLRRGHIAINCPTLEQNSDMKEITKEFTTLPPKPSLSSSSISKATATA